MILRALTGLSIRQPPAIVQMVLCSANSTGARDTLPYEMVAAWVQATAYASCWGNDRDARIDASAILRGEVLDYQHTEVLAPLSSGGQNPLLFCYPSRSSCACCARSRIPVCTCG